MRGRSRRVCWRGAFELAGFAVLLLPLLVYKKNLSSLVISLKNTSYYMVSISPVSLSL